MSGLSLSGAAVSVTAPQPGSDDVLYFLVTVTRVEPELPRSHAAGDVKLASLRRQASHRQLRSKTSGGKDDETRTSVSDSACVPSRLASEARQFGAPCCRKPVAGSWRVLVSACDGGSRHAEYVWIHPRVCRTGLQNAPWYVRKGTERKRFPDARVPMALLHHTACGSSL